VLSIDADPEPYLATAAEMLSAEGMNDAVNVLRIAKPKVEATGYDNWNGGTTIWTIYLQVAPAEYARLGAKREPIEKQIATRLESILEPYTDDWFGVTVVPRTEPKSGWRDAKGDIPEDARRNIFDGLRIDQVVWSGRLDDVEFLERLYDLTALPSNDSRFEDAAGDIWQHRINNDDLPDDWVFDDRRFNLLSGTTDTFLRFLCEIVHPVVRPDKDEAIKLVEQFNDQLRRHGWHLVEEEKIAGRPRYVAKRITDFGSGRSVSRAKTVADALNAGWMQKEIERLENAVERDPALAIGTAKELVETCCKSILSKRGVPVSRRADLPELTKLLAKELELVPEDISDKAKGHETIRLILRNLAALTQYLAELRGLYGSGHGRDGKYRGLEPRHARLAVGAAVAFIDFVTATFHKREIQKGSHAD
tara:strand:+ start:736 stop:1998 length:1263 start_codon:yes stop_codon:yes gene_type:complete